MLVRDSYAPLLIYLLVSLIFVFILFFLSYFLGPKVPSIQKLSIYECGFEPINNSHLKFHVKFYLITLLFVLFDLEIVFILPWAVNLVTNVLLRFYVMFVFLVLLLIGFIYEYQKGSLEW